MVSDLSQQSTTIGASMTPEQIADLPDDQLENFLLNGVTSLLESAGAELAYRYGGDAVTQVGMIGTRKVHIRVEIEERP